MQKQNLTPLGITVVEYALLCVMLTHRIKGVRTTAAKVGGFIDKSVDLDRLMAALIKKGYVSQSKPGCDWWRPTQFGMMQLVAHLCEMPDCPDFLSDIPSDEMDSILSETFCTAA